MYYEPDKTNKFAAETITKMTVLVCIETFETESYGSSSDSSDDGSDSNRSGSASYLRSFSSNSLLN